MSTNKIAALVSLFDAPKRAGESLNQFLQKLEGNGAILQAALKRTVTLSATDMGNSATQRLAFVAPHNLEITAIKAVAHSTTGAAVAGTINNRDAAANSDKNPLSAANIDFDALTTDNEAEAQALSATTANLQMNAGDVLTLTVTTDGSSAAELAAISIEYDLIQALG